ncbi:uncharacterized protein LOC143864434 [Tasmannia lanceolata]|uniref:uncharacterized protein LOC143864434 n=1 Tax=Tasmannia lanceolata TaxID=3420 RepID=UPI0040647245
MVSLVFKMKQSSIDSFLLPNKTNTNANTNTPDYERLRLENIRRNQKFFEKLGILECLPPNPKPKSKPNPKPNSKPSQSLPNSSLPVRRSTRKRPTPSDEEEQEEENPKEEDTIQDPIFKYNCWASPDLENPSLPSNLTLDSPISGFKVLGKTLHDPFLKRIYTIDVSKPIDRRSFLVAAGGHGGFISIYKVGKEDEEGDDSYETQKQTQGPIMCWKGSKSWVSGVMFVKDNPMLLVSSSNDGAIVVWGTMRRRPQILRSSSSRSPHVVAESRSLHSNGIFGMDQFNGLIATASKDSSVGICRVTMAGELVTQRSLSGHHLGAIRGVCFRDTEEILADCGADGCICVLDTRVPQPCTLTINSNRSTGVNTVEWCPSKEFLLLSASKDPTLLLYDIRNFTEPVQKLQGHVESNVKTCYQIYKPTFIDNGMAVATPGQGSMKISIYNVERGNLISQGKIGYDANLVFFTSGDTGQQKLWAAGKKIHQLFPMRLPQT